MKLYKEKNDKKAQEKAVKTESQIAIGIIIALALLGVVIFGLFRDFDAQGYVKAILSQTFKGEVEAVVEMTEETTEEELLVQYEEGIRSFVTSNLTGGVEMSEEMQEQYIELCKEIFASVTYKVKGAEKVSRKEYKVPVEYNSVDIFKTFSESIKEESARLLQKVDSGEYKGTVEEINAQMEKEFLENSYQLLVTAFEQVEQAESETLIFTVKKDDGGLFKVDDAKVHELVIKIMGLDEIQD